MAKERILGINPWIYDFAAYNAWLRPLGFLYLLETLEQKGAKVDFVDCLAMPDGEVWPARNEFEKKYATGKFRAEKVVKPAGVKNVPRYYRRYGIAKSLFINGVKRFPYRFALITSSMTYWYPGVFEVIRLIKEIHRDIVIVLGGTYATLCKEHAAEHSGANFVIGNSDIEDFNALIKGHLGIDLDFSAHTAFGLPLRYKFYDKLDFAAIRVTTGCPFKCSYCASGKLSPGFWVRDPEVVKDELKSLYKRGVRNFAFYDDALLYKKDIILEIASFLVKELPRAFFHTPNGLHARFLDEKLAEALKRANFIDPRLGLEFVRGGERYHDKVEPDEVVRAIGYLTKAGFKKRGFSVYIMVGIPGEDRKAMGWSIREFSRLGARIRLNEYSPIPGSALYDRYFPEGIDPIYHNNSIFPLLDNEEIKEVQELKNLTKELNGSLALRKTSPSGKIV